MTDKYTFDSPVDRTHTGSMKWDKYKGKDILPLWVADMDFQSPPEVIDALRERVNHGVFGYTVPEAQFARTIVERFGKLYRWKIEPEWVVGMPGLVTGLNVTCRAVGNTGDRVMVATPVYPPFLTAPGYMERQVTPVPMKTDGKRWQMDMNAAELAATDDTSLFILCNPHNPVGRIFNREELEELLEFSLRHDIVVCADEIHCDLLLDTDKPHIPFATLGKEAADRTISLFAPSKTYNRAWAVHLPSSPIPRCGGASIMPPAASYPTSTVSGMWRPRRPIPTEMPGWLPCWTICAKTATPWPALLSTCRVSTRPMWRPPILPGWMCGIADSMILPRTSKRTASGFPSARNSVCRDICV
jgi:hypothetical protein